MVNHPGTGKRTPLGRERDPVAEERGRPRDEQRQGTQDQTPVALGTAVRDKLHTPVQGTEEGEDRGAIGDLDVLDRVQVRECGLKVEPGEILDAWIVVSVS